MIAEGSGSGVQPNCLNEDCVICHKLQWHFKKSVHALVSTSTEQGIQCTLFVYRVIMMNKYRAYHLESIQYMLIVVVIYS